MGLFDFIFGSRVPEIRDPDQLWQALYQAARAGYGRRLEKLCRVNREGILAHFPQWQKVPEEVRSDPAAVQPYVESMIAIAQTFADRLGSQELMQRLIGTEQNNPLLRWQEGLRRAEEMMADLRYPEARELLSDLLIDARNLQGSGVETYLPITLGRLGECYFQNREADKAGGPQEQALQLCQQQGDVEGVAAYLGSLYEVHRYLGQAESAAGYAGRLADALDQQGRKDDARRYRKQSEIVRAGEPLNRVVAVVDGRRYELDELGAVRDQRVQFQFERNRITLQPATVLTGHGEELSSAGRYDEALDACCAATEADPFDPHAHYQKGLALLHLQRPLEAVESYEATEERAPGWFHCRADLWLARQRALGELSHEAFLTLYVLEDGPAPPEEKVRLAERALGHLPHLAPLHLLRAINLGRLGRSQDAQEAYQQGLACGPEPDVKTRLLVELGVLVSDPAERVSLLREAEGLKGNLVAAAIATLALRTLPQ
jgi:tetratricopeptide (TPR) repeat protein